MIYSNPEFFVLFLTTFAAYLLSKSYRTRFFVLTAASLAFYSWAGPLDTFVYLLVVFVSWLAVYTSTVFPQHKPKLTFAAVFVMTLHLAFWKYANWVIGGIQGFYPDFLGGKPPQIKLPVGISFFTLQGIAYVVDFHRGLAQRLSFKEYLLFKSFFAQLVAGPIVRAKELVPQLKLLPAPSSADMRQGLGLFALGFFKKLIIADRVSIFVDAVFGAPQSQTRATLILAMLGYTCQIWADFSGYTDMGRGAARMLGIRLPFNFHEPYLSKSPSEFWRRWHISLSRWIRDYIYIPLGGNQGSAARVALVVTLTMFISGLWHGANWTFVCWGLLHGMYLVFERFVKRVPFPRSTLTTMAGWAVFFAATNFAWILFRSASIEVFGDYMKALIRGTGSSPRPSFANNVYLALALTISLHLLFYKREPETGESFFDRLHVRWNRAVAAAPQHAIEGAVFALSIVFALLLRNPKSDASFIYFQF